MTISHALGLLLRLVLFAAGFGGGWGVILYFGFDACPECSVNAGVVYFVVALLGGPFMLALARSPRSRRPPRSAIVIVALGWGVAHGVVAYIRLKTLAGAILVGALVATYVAALVLLFMWLFRAELEAGSDKSARP